MVECICGWHVRIACAYLRNILISETAGRIATKFGAVRDPLYKSLIQVRDVVQPHVRPCTPLSRIWGTVGLITLKCNAWLGYASALATCFAQVSGGVDLHVRKCIPLFRISGTAGLR